MKALIVLLDIVTREFANYTRLDNIKMSTEYLGLPKPVVGPLIANTHIAAVTWCLKDGQELRALKKYMDETEAMYVVRDVLSPPMECEHGCESICFPGMRFCSDACIHCEHGGKPCSDECRDNRAADGLPVNTVCACAGEQASGTCTCCGLPIIR